MGTLSEECKLWKTLHNKQPGFFYLKKNCQENKQTNNGMEPLENDIHESWKSSD